MVKRQGDLDIIFAALSDATRRTIIERLTHGELTAGEIAAGFSVSQPAISKHLSVLERSGLLKRNVVGREHHLRLSPRAMRRASDGEIALRLQRHADLSTSERFNQDALNKRPSDVEPGQAQAFRSEHPALAEVDIPTFVDALELDDRFRFSCRDDK